MKWGILGPGTIANKFVKGLGCIEYATVHAVGELPEFYDKAVVFAKEYNIPNVYKGIDKFCEDEEIDIVYVSMINTMHKKAVLECLKAGKNVLCEKPIGINKIELEEMRACAKENDVFLMEAFWTNFIPSIVKAKEWISNNLIGEIKSITADFGFRVEDRSGRHFNKALGGGVLLDVGTYTIGLPIILMGEKPSSVDSRVYMSKEGVDEVDSIQLNYDNGVFVRIHNSFSCSLRNDCYIYGTKGYIYIPDFWHAEEAQLYINGELKEKFYEPFITTGYNFEAEEVMDCISKGKKESDKMSLDISLSILEIMDKIRYDAGFKFEGE